MLKINSRTFFLLKKSSRLKFGRIIFLCVLIFKAFSVSSQPENFSLNNYKNEELEKLFNLKKSNSHAAIRPVLINRNDIILHEDSFPSLIYKKLLRNKIENKKKFIVTLLPLVNFSYGVYSSDSTTLNTAQTTGVGLLLKSKLGNRLFLEGSFLGSNGSYPSYLESFIENYKVLPGQGIARPTSRGYFNLDYNAYLSFDASKYFNFQLGQGKNFIGEGYRSLLLSDNAFSYPYFKISTSIWNIKYVNLSNVWKDIRFANGQFSNNKIKYSSIHYLSWNATKRLNIGLFESIIWQSSDTLSNRGFDVNYLNPVIFYRPVEYSIGSADNAIVGLHLSFKTSNKSKLYGQLIVDEFLLKEIRARNGWWANKYGGQLGLKVFDFAKVEGLNFQIELNAVRPFTYSHGSIYQSYLHFNQPVAHPLGSNFVEGIAIVNFSKKRWRFENQFNYAMFGRDSLQRNQGGDIFKSYANPSAIYGNKIGQGIKHITFINQLKTYYLIDKETNLRAEAIFLIRNEKVQNKNSNTLFFSVGITSTLGNKYYDF